MAQKIVFTFKDDSKDDLFARSQRMIRNGPPFKLVGTGRSVQFLRGVFSRASLCLPAFYYFLGSASAHDEAKTSPDFPFKVAQTYSEFSDLNTLSLNCRKIFDHASKPDLTGANFAKSSDATLQEHAKYWSNISARSIHEALTALKFLRRFFSECSKTDTELLQADSQLQKRIGLLKQHADRAAAHLSLENYELDIKDLAHFTGACVLVGEIIRSFDSPSLGPNYFNEVDAGSYQAAKRIFPQISKFQLFANIKLEQQARIYWQFEDEGIYMLLNRLHYALGGDPTEPPSPPLNSDSA
jgi:hypothetical protein